MQHRAALRCQSRHVSTISRAAAARSDAPIINLTRLPDTEQIATVVERRAADVCVVGGSCTAVLAAYSLAKAGRKVRQATAVAHCIRAQIDSPPVLRSIYSIRQIASRQPKLW